VVIISSPNLHILSHRNVYRHEWEVLLILYMESHLQDIRSVNDALDRIIVIAIIIVKAVWNVFELKELIVDGAAYYK